MVGWESVGTGAHSYRQRGGGVEVEVREVSGGITRKWNIMGWGLVKGYLGSEISFEMDTNK